MMDYKENSLVVNNIICNKNKVVFEYTPKGITLDAITNSLEFFIEYNEDISTVPKSILAIPFVCDVLPFIWIQDSCLILDELDKSFYESIIHVKRAYIDMFPNITFRGKVIVNKLIDNTYLPTKKRLTLFSGGVDSTSTLCTHLNEDLDLLSIWGADIYFNDEEGWSNLCKYGKELENIFHISFKTAKSCFKRNLKYLYLNEFTQHKYPNYWHSFQHGLGLIGHFAPLVYKHKYEYCFIPASSSVKDEFFATCASYPTIDEHVKICGCSIIHDGWELNRLDRVENICKYAKQYNYRFYLRVCFLSKNFDNCCYCEKCLRTIVALLLNNIDPKEFGFDYDVAKLDSTMHSFISNYKVPKLIHVEWLSMKHKYMEVKESLNDDYKNLLKYLQNIPE